MPIDRIVPAGDDPMQPGPARGFLRGRCALVTGGARRIGQHLALALAGQGAAVVIHFNKSATEAEATAERIRDAGGEAHLVGGDLQDPGFAEELVDTSGGFGLPVDILVNNASVFAEGDALTATTAEWDRHQAINLRAPFLLAQGMARQLPAGAMGDVVNLNDIRAVQPGADHFPYTISKVGLHGLTMSLAQALAPDIRVNELVLGPVLPPDRPTAEYVHTTRQEIPLARFNKPTEVSSALLFLLGNRGVTGQSLFIDGGLHLR